MPNLTELSKFPPSTKVAILRAILTDYKTGQLEDEENLAEEIVSILLEDLEGNIGVLDLLSRLLDV